MPWKRYKQRIENSKRREWKRFLVDENINGEIPVEEEKMKTAKMIFKV